jgi:hypothetical protein
MQYYSYLCKCMMYDVCCLGFFKVVLYIQVTLQAVAVLHIGHASGRGGVTYMSRFRQWQCYIYVTLQAVAVLHICHASGNGGVTYMSRFRQWWRYIYVTLQAVDGGVTFMRSAE